MAFGRYSIEIDRFQDVVPSEGRQSPKIERPKTADFSTENPILLLLAKLAPPTEPVAALAYWGSIGSIIGGVLAVTGIYEIISGRKVKNVMVDIQKDLNALIGINPIVKRTKKRKKPKILSEFVK